MADKQPPETSAGAPEVVPESTSAEKELHHSSASSSSDEIEQHSAERVATQVEKSDEGTTAIAAAKTDTQASITVYPHGLQLVFITIGLQLAVFCLALDNTIIATAIPKITDDFHAIADVGWYGSAYLLTNCTFQLLFGKVYTYLPLKPVFLVSLLIFEVGSVVCGAAPNSTALIVGRAVAGLGAGGLFSGALVILSAAVPLAKRPMFIGAVSSMFGLASVVGPLMGGAFTDHVTWRLCFYINLPLGLVTAVAITFFFQSPPRHRASGKGWREIAWQFDPIGVLCFIPSIVCLLLALQWGGTKYAWSSGRIIALFVVFGVLIIAFVVDQIWMKENATVPPRIITMARDIPSAMLWAFCLGSGFFTFVYYLPIWFQAIHGDSATNSGIHTLPFLLAQVLSSIGGGIAISKAGYYVPIMCLSVIFTATGAGLITTFHPTIPIAHWIGYQIIYGLGTGFGFQQAILIAQTVLPRMDIPIGSSVMMFCQILGGALFVSVSQNTFQNALVTNLFEAVPGINVEAVIGAGATGFIGIIPEQYLPAALDAYNESIVKAFRVGLIMTCLTVLGLAGQRFRNIKQKKKEVGEKVVEAGEAEMPPAV